MAKEKKARTDVSVGSLSKRILPFCKVGLLGSQFKLKSGIKLRLFDDAKIWSKSGYLSFIFPKNEEGNPYLQKMFSLSAIS